MLVYTPFGLCFVTLRGVFMHFPELTYYRDTIVPVSCFLLFLCFRKATQEIFSELDKTKAKPPIFPKWDKVQRWDGGEPRAGHTLGWRGPGLGHATRGWAALVYPLMPPFHLYIPLDRKNLNTRSIFQKHIMSHRHHWPEIGRIHKLFPAPYRRGESLPEAFFIDMPASGAMRE
jgi:hypothetical protein